MCAMETRVHMTNLTRSDKFSVVKIDIFISLVLRYDSKRHKNEAKINQENVEQVILEPFYYKGVLNL